MRVADARDPAATTAHGRDRPPDRRISPLLVVTLAVLAIWSLGVVAGFLWPLRILAACGALAAVQIRWRPQLALVGVAGLCALDPVIRFYLADEVIRWNTFNYWLVLVAIASVPFQLRTMTSHTALLGALCFLVIVGLLYTSDLPGGVQHTIHLVAAYFALRFYVARALDADEDALYRVGFVTAWLVAGGGLVYMLHRSSLPEINSNALSAFLVTGPVAAAVAVGASRLGRTTPRYHDYVLWIPAAAGFAWIVLSGSRGSMAVGAVCLLYLAVTSRGLAALGVAAVLAIVFIGGLTLFPDRREAAIGKIEDLVSSDESIADRTDQRSSLALGAIDLARDDPFGVGTGGFRDALADSPHTIGVAYEPHSAWAKVLGENGVGALVLALAFVLSYPVEAARRRDASLLILSVMTAAAMSLAFMTSEFQAKWIWFLAAGVAELQRRVPVPPSVARVGTPAPPRR